MKRLNIEIDIPMEASAFFRLYVEGDLHQSHARDAGLSKSEEIERREVDGEIHSRSHIIPHYPIPKTFESLAEKLLPGGLIEYHEDHIVRPAKLEVEWRVWPFVMRDRHDIHGFLRVVPVADDRCKVLIEGSAQVRIPGVGSMIERIIVQEVNTRYRRLPDTFEKWRSQ